MEALGSTRPTVTAPEVAQLVAHYLESSFPATGRLFAKEASTLLARGLVLRRDATGATEVVAMPWPKFFNLGEDGLTLKELAARTEGGGHVEVTSKMDGSLGLVFHVEGGWRVCTKGSFTSEQGRWATSWLSEHVDVSALAVGTTYLVEIIYSDNRIVIPCKTGSICVHASHATDL